MKPDPFDEHIRRKLERVEPAYREQAWKQMQRYLSQQAPGLAWRGGRAWVLYGGIALTILGLLTGNWVQYQQNQALTQKADTLRRALTALRQAPPRRVVETRTDTLYITRVVPGRAVGVPVPGPARLVEVPGTAVPGREVAGTAVGPATAEVSPMPTQPSTQPAALPARQEPVNQADSRAEALENAPRSNTETMAKPMDSAAGNVQGVRSVEATARPQGSFVGQSGGLPPTMPPLAVAGAYSPALSGAEIEQLVRKQLADLNFVAIRGLQLQPGAWASKRLHKFVHERLLAARPSIRRAPVVVPTPPRYRVGMVAEVAQGSYGGGLSSEFIVHKNWSLSLGLTQMSRAAGQFFTDIHYNALHKPPKPQNDFRSMFAPRLPPTVEIINITQRENTVQIPLSLTRRQPLRYGLTVLASAGTALNLSRRQNLVYSYSPDLRAFETAKLQSKEEIPLLTSLDLSLGIEKRWGRAALQLLPTYSQRPNPLPNEPSLPAPVWSLRTRVLFDLRR